MLKNNFRITILLLIILIGVAVKEVKCQDSIVRPHSMIGLTPVKFIFTNYVELSFLKKQSESKFLGAGTSFYLPVDNYFGIHYPGVKAFISQRKFYSQKRSSSFFTQINLIGGYFFHDVTYVTEFFPPRYEEYYPIYRFKRYLAAGGSALMGYQVFVKHVSFEWSIGLRALVRILDSSVSYQGEEFYRKNGAYEGFLSENGDWAMTGPGSILVTKFTVRYNILD